MLTGVSSVARLGTGEIRPWPRIAFPCVFGPLGFGQYQISEPEGLSSHGADRLDIDAVGQGWWTQPPKRSRGAYGIALAVAIGSVLGFLFFVPVQHSATADYMLLVAIPSNTSSPSCQGASFQQTGVYSFTWYVPNGNPTFLTVYNSTENSSRATLYHGLTNGGAAGSFSVDSDASTYDFCLETKASSPAPAGPFSVVTVSGGLSYRYAAPML